MSRDDERQIAQAIARLHDLENYPFTALELSASVDEEQVADIFVRINSKGITLNQADFILTLMSVFWDHGRKELEQFCRKARLPAKGEASPYNHFVEPAPDQLLRAAVGLGFRRARLKFVYSILRGKDLETGTFSEERRHEQFDVLREAQTYALDLQHWDDYFKALLRAGFRSGKMVTSKTTLFYCYVMFLIGKRDYGLDHHTLRNVIARWFFMCNISRRYTGSPESTMAGDLARLRSAETAGDFVTVLDRIIRDTLTQDFWDITLPNELDSSSHNSPTLFAYHAALNLLDARALFSEIKIADLLDTSTNAKKADVERHHLFPRNYLKKQGVTTTSVINQIANYAHVEWADNIQISDQAPAQYFPQHAACFDNNELKQMMQWHALPSDWEHMTYADFLEERRKRIAQVTRQGFERLTSKVKKIQARLA